MDLCVVCTKPVTRRQQALGPCDECGQWQHRKCNTGITPQQYRQLQEAEEFAWVCNVCRDRQTQLDFSVPAIESPLESLSFEMTLALNTAFIKTKSSFHSTSTSSAFDSFSASMTAALQDSIVANAENRCEDEPISRTSPGTADLNRTYTICRTSQEYVSDTDQLARTSPLTTALLKSDELNLPTSSEDAKSKVINDDISEIDIINIKSADIPFRASQQIQIPLAEDSVQQPHTDIIYKIVERGTERGKPALTDSHGWKYVRHRELKNGSVDWICSIRRKDCSCLGAVKQIGTNFRMVREHTCNSQFAGRSTAVEMKRDMKDEAFKDKFRSAKKIVADVFVNHLTGEKELPEVLPTFASLVRLTNRAREKQRQ